MTGNNKQQKLSGSTDTAIAYEPLLPAVYFCENPKTKVREAKITDYGDCAKLEIKYYYKQTGLAGTYQTDHKSLTEAKRWYGRQIQQQKYFEKPVWILNGR